MNKINIMGFGAVGVRDVIRNGRQYGRYFGFYFNSNLPEKCGNCKFFYSKFVKYEYDTLNILLLLAAIYMLLLFFFFT